MKNKILLLALFIAIFTGCQNDEPEDQPYAKFTYSVKDLTITFKNESQHANKFVWHFGDESATSEANPKHTYAKAGTYEVSLTATNITKTHTYTAQVVVSKAAPQAKFSYKADGLQVTFTNQSSNANSYSWNFGNGQTSTQKDPSITYSAAGTYSVSLTASDGDATNTYSQNITVSYKQPTANFTYKTEAPLKVVLTNTSTNATTYEWDFGDGTTSKEKNPTHRYAAVGSYIITLVSKNPSGSQQHRETVEIIAPKVFVTGLQLKMVGQEGKYYRSVCKDDDFFSNTWWSTSYTPMLTSSNLPYSIPFSTPVEMTGLDGDTYYTVYVYWNTKTSGDGTQILKQKMYTSEIKTYPEYIDIFNSNVDTWIRVFFDYKL